MKAFMCMRTGLYFPGDYVENWGKKYGIGLGCVPVSESLLNSYWAKRAISADGSEVYPVMQSYAAIQQVDVTPEEYDAHKAILAKDDTSMSERTKILVGRQRANKQIKPE